MISSQPISSLFPYTTLFRSGLVLTVAQCIQQNPEHKTAVKKQFELLAQALPQQQMVLHSTSTNILMVLITERSEEHTSELQSRPHLVCRLLLEKKKKTLL